MKKLLRAGVALGAVITLFASGGTVPAQATMTSSREADEFVFVRTVLPGDSLQFTTRSASTVRVANNGIVDAQMCDSSQVLQASTADGPGDLGLSFARQVQSQASIAVTAGVSASVTAEIGLNATFQGFGATGKLGTTIGASLSSTFGYNVLDSTTITSSYSTPVPAGESWTVKAYPAFAKYNYSIYANTWKNGTQPIAAGQLLSPVGYCYKTTQLKKIGIATGFVAADSTASGAAVRYQRWSSEDTAKWAFAPDGTIRLGGQNLCLETPGGDWSDGAPVGLWACHGAPNQRWIRSGQTIVNAGTGKCLDLRGSEDSPGSRLIVYVCTGGNNQKWTV